MLICKKDWYGEYSNTTRRKPLVSEDTKFYKYIDATTGWYILDDISPRLRGMCFPKEYFTQMSERVYRILYE